ncbi:hypothetical protein GGR21_001727 [Dysgonomonas hofstadii]|uniref:Uncharacterized protein n=1 Tax=Dysgonomonas hofstadii TaxID=637886 RepID=A0A840CTI6_9BACT|nr:hypothetical protein [Dysgonomonas hofstadii]
MDEDYGENKTKVYLIALIGCGIILFALFYLFMR